MTATEIGTEHGKNAASWVEINSENAKRLLAGINDCDPEILDALPQPNLSGEWADNYPTLRDLADTIGKPLSDDLAECNEYEDAFRVAVESEIIRRCQCHLGR